MLTLGERTPLFIPRVHKFASDGITYLIDTDRPNWIALEQSGADVFEKIGETAPTFGARFVNVHIGSHRGSGVDVGIARLVDGIEQVLERSNGRAADTMLVLENSAGGGGGLGTSLDELTVIADGLGQRGIDRAHVGFCLDVAHAWGAGIDVGDPAVIDAFLAGFDARIGVDRLVMIHLNDTRSGFASRTDRHEHLGAGRIPVAGLTHFLRHPRLTHAAYILETPGMDAGYDAVNIQRARTLWAGKPLPTLPPEAFTLTSSSKGRMSSSTRKPPAP